MRILVDADACPASIRDILCKAAKRVKRKALFFANHALPIPRSEYTSQVHVPKGFDVADHTITQQVEPGDLVVTNDIPLADAVIEKGAVVLTTKGEHYTKTNIKQVLDMRNFMTDMRDAGQVTGGPKPQSARDIQQFANALDRLLQGHR